MPFLTNLDTDLPVYDDYEDDHPSFDDSVSPMSACSTNTDGRTCYCPAEPRPSDLRRVVGPFKRHQITGRKLYAEHWVKDRCLLEEVTWGRLNHRWYCELTEEERQQWEELAEEVRDEEWVRPMPQLFFAKQELTCWYVALVSSTPTFRPFISVENVSHRRRTALPN
ncbi:hypothetical protein NM688_g4503 [Phlebia brevispora]|uniref:Uncharacterized protein n=1 Tax=Phlebia brevispora TaxID=194682 RepID=A0ACC1T2X0_9APHY|nr:hypothetical protein NM688_g4503 [Phlebia brevispora]